MPDFTQVLSGALNVGLAASLLVVFVMYFINHDKKRDEIMRSQTEKYDAHIKEQFKSFYERENMLLAEKARSEELLRGEAASREKLLREEALKRESFLIRAIEETSQTMKEISKTLADIKSAGLKVENKVDRIEGIVERLKGAGA